MKNAQKGFGLTEVIVTAGVLSGLALGVASVLTQAAKGQKGVNEVQAVQELVNTIHLVLNRNNACDKTFIDAPSEADFNRNKVFNLKSLKIPTSSSINGLLIAEESNKIPGVPSLEVPKAGITLQNLGKPMASNNKPVSESIYFAELGVQIQKVPQGRAPLSSLGVAKFDRRFKTIVSFDSTGKLVTCGQLPSFSEGSGAGAGKDAATDTGTGTGPGTDTGTGPGTDTGTGPGTATRTITGTDTGTGPGTATETVTTTSRTCAEQPGKYVASLSSDGTCKYSDLPSAQSFCKDLGGRWDVSRCVMPGSENKIVSGVVNIPDASRGSGDRYVQFPPGTGFVKRPFVILTPKWIRHTGDEAVTWGVTHVNQWEFKISWHGPDNDGKMIGDPGFYWIAVERN